VTEAFAACDLAEPDPEDTRRIIGLSVHEALGRLCARQPPEQLERVAVEFRRAFQALSHETEPLYDGAEAALRLLAGRDDTFLGIATGKSQRGVQRILEHYGFGGCFSTIQTADDAPSKPHPAMISQAMGHVGADQGRTVMIGDTTYDMEMAAHAGVPALGVAWGYHPADELAGAGARQILGHFNQLETVLESLWQ